ncbi:MULTISPECIES: NIL domain-containing protein [Fischerella]|uniref:NIL domain-containing protein n=1 Tax=Fischerella muscicola CCMEE 5323 TaxID=2019572 RepID=A0A2N6JXF9_FISMU|nr:MULTISPECIES: NIL domain-containing protein [Fischerella]MBD2432754.1 NIL domain-containing protein [Fischerella sp. FACHB-380]PLZ85166.1 hypothetical protein CEN44_22920 [Fischerella muscicola CCMEE 5323]
MTTLNHQQNIILSNFSKHSNATQIRLRLYIPACYQHQPVISQLISKYNLVVNITGASLGKNTGYEGYFDIQIRGDISQISSGLSYLESLNLKIVGKPNVDGDSWFC